MSNMTNDESDFTVSNERPVCAADVTDYSTADYRQTRARARGSMLMVGVLVAGLIGVYYTFLKTGPQSAAAAITSETGPAGKTIAKYLTVAPVNVRAMSKQIQTLE